MLSMTIEDDVKGLNKWDAFPIVSSLFSGPVRILAGVVQLIAGFILGCLSIALGWIGGLDSWGRDIQVNFTEIFHGIGNLFRGKIALTPLAGNLVLYLYDRLF